ncbi:MAG: hypothetical protein AAF478_04745 [Pseudomonadota bacterium]
MRKLIIALFAAATIALPSHANESGDADNGGNTSDVVSIEEIENTYGTNGGPKTDKGTTIDTRRIGLPNGSTNDKGPQVDPRSHPGKPTENFDDPLDVTSNNKVGKEVKTLKKRPGSMPIKEPAKEMN